MTTNGEPGSDAPLPRSIFVAVFLLSLAVLMVQIALNRIFSFLIWYHFAYISVSLALLGFGASGSMVAAFPSLIGRSIQRSIGIYAAICAVTSLVMLVVIGMVPLHPFEIFSNSNELAKFVLYFFVVSIPFILCRPGDHDRAARGGTLGQPALLLGSDWSRARLRAGGLGHRVAGNSACRYPGRAPVCCKRSHRRRPGRSPGSQQQPRARRGRAGPDRSSSRLAPVYSGQGQVHFCLPRTGHLLLALDLHLPHGHGGLSWQRSLDWGISKAGDQSQLRGLSSSVSHDRA